MNGVMKYLLTMGTIGSWATTCFAMVAFDYWLHAQGVRFYWDNGGTDSLNLMGIAGFLFIISATVMGIYTLVCIHSDSD